MTFSWRRRRGGRKDEASNGINQDNMELTIPIHFKCPISLELMKDPVTLSTGITYDRESIEKWIEGGNVVKTCPVTNQVLRNLDQIPNHSIRKMIQDWCVENKSCGVERIPTPRIPVAPYEVSSICTRIEAATQRGDSRMIQELLVKIKNLAKESERNKRCIVANGIGSTLADSFEWFARISGDENVNVLLKEILSALTWTLLPHHGQELRFSKLKSEVSLRCMVWFLKSDNDLSSRQNAICVLRELVISSEQDCVDTLMGIEGIEETLLQIVKVPICPKATKATLVVIHHLMMSSSTTRNSGTDTSLRFVQMGLLPLVLEILVDGDKSACEKALGVIDSICSTKEGRESAYKNSLAIPLLVKKILRVSDTATEFSITSLWKLCLGENENAVVEAVQLGAFQKLLVVLQIGGGERTKEKVTDLLKLMNLYKDKLDCFDSSAGFKYVKRSN